MSGKVHAFMVFLGVLLMTGAGGVYVRYGLGRGEPRSAAPTVSTTRDAGPDAPSTPSPPTTPAGTPTPAPTAAPTRTLTPTPKPTTAKPTTAKPTTTATATTAPTWRLSWSDDFTGGALDDGKWSVTDGIAVDLACMTNRDENLAVTGGILVLRAQVEQYACGSATSAYTAALLTARTNLTYGAVEIRAKSPNAAATSAGVYPVIWLDSATGQIEVAAAPGGSATYRSVTQGVAQVGGAVQEQTYTFPSGFPGDGFHTYRVEWEPGVIRWYVDGTLTYQRDRTTTTWFDSVFAQAHTLRLALRIGTAGEPDAQTAFPAEFQLEYVRVYQR